MKIWTAFERLTAADLNANFDDPAKAVGTFTPTIVGATTPGVGTYTSQVGRYYRIGRLVYVDVRIVWTAHTGTGPMRIAGLPYAVSAAISGIDAEVIGPITTDLTLAAPVATGRDGQSYLAVVTAAPAGGVNVVAAATLNVAGVYRTAAA